MATALQLAGLALLVAGGVIVAGVGGALIAGGVSAIYFGLAAEANR